MRLRTPELACRPSGAGFSLRGALATHSAHFHSTASGIRSLRILALAIPLCLAALADDISISGPTMGLVYSAGVLRPVLGIPGAAYVGSALPLDATPDLVAIAPEQSFALVLTAGKWSILDASKGKLTLRDLPGLDDSATVWFSPAGKSALLLSADSLHARLLTGLPAQPVITASLTLSEPATLAAVSEDARFSLTAAASGVISQWDADGNLRGTVPLGDVAALQFFNRSGDALAASHSNRQVYKLSEAGNSTPIAALDVTATATSSDDSTMILVASDGSIQTLSAAGDTAASFTSPVPPSRLQRMGGVLRLNDYGSGPIAVFDGTQVMLIPPAKDGGDR